MMKVTDKTSDDDDMSCGLSSISNVACRRVGRGRFVYIFWLIQYYAF